MEEGPTIVTKAYDVTSWLLQQVNTFPRAYRFVLGDRIASTALDILEGLVEASHRRDKRAVLDTVNLKLESLRYLIRMSKDLQVLSLCKYEYVAREINEVGAMLGGWLKQQRGREP
jgi:four helix bundle protein